MADPVLAQKDPNAVIAEALALYKRETGVTLGQADPRRLHLQTFLLLLAQQRQLIDFSGKQSLLRFVADEWIDELAALWGEKRIPAAPSQNTQRFNFATVAARTIPAGVRVTDGTNIWGVVTDTSATGAYVDTIVKCRVAGGATNGIAIGQIDTVVDPDRVPGCTSTSNVTETVSGRDREALEDFRARLRDVPESRSTCGPRGAYKAAALAASASVADAAVLGPDDGGQMAGPAPGPGHVLVLLIEGKRDDKGVLTSVVPEPGAGVIAAVDAALSAEDVRPLTDFVTERAPQWQDFNAIATYYIGESRSGSASAIQAAAQKAFAAYLLWQQSAIGRDINPSELIARLVAAGAKRVDVASPPFVSLKRDESARLLTQTLTFGGIEDD